MSTDYKETLNLPQTEFSMKANLTRREPEFLQFWEDKDIYRKIQEKNSGDKSFILHDGPPYANGHIHMGHALNKILKDIIVKYKSMKGYYAPYIPGWDCHGLPIELQVDKKLGKKKATTSQSEKRGLCREYAERFVDIQRDEFRRLGVFGDWDDPYLTMSYDYEASIIREFYKFVQGGYVYKGKKPVHWCPSCVTALAEAEVEHADKVSPSIYVRFRITESSLSSLKMGSGSQVSSLFFIIWTTTPWTLPANLALAVHPEVEYSVVESGGNHYIVASALVEKVSEALGIEGTVIEQIKGDRLLGMKAEHPFLNRESIVIEGDFVTTDEGTGIVHIAPGHGEDDYLAGMKHNLDIYAPVDDYGRFTLKEHDLEGVHVFKANDQIIEILQSNGSLLGSKEMAHSYPHCWRCKKPVIFRATEQWFISVDHAGLRSECLKEIDRVEWIPEWGSERIRGMMERRPDWCISRQRSWGVPIALLTCNKCGSPLKDQKVFDSILRLFEEQGADAWFNTELESLLPDGHICQSCGGWEFSKETDILDVWFDSGVSHAAVLEADSRLSWPADLYLEGSDQHRGWFHSSLLASAGTKDRAPYDSVLTHGFVVDGSGKKMSKSLGNVISPENIIRKSGAEILRLWVSAEDYRNDIRLSNEILSRLIDAYRKIRNTSRFLLGNLHDFDHQDYSSNLTELDRWALSRLQALVKRVSTAYDRYEFHEVFHSIYSFCIVEMSSFYLDILKDRLYTFASDSPERRAAQWSMHRILVALTQLMAPVVSFTAEEIWQFIPGEMSESVFLSSFPEVDESFIDEELEKRWEGLIESRNVVNKAIELKRADKVIGNSLQAKVTVFAEGERYELLKEYSDLLTTLFIVSGADIKPLSDADASAYRPETATEGPASALRDIGGIAVMVEHAEGGKCSRCWNWSITVGNFEDEPEACERCYKVLKVED